MDRQVDDKIIELMAVVAIQLHHKHRSTSLADSDDIRQELWIWFTKRRDKFMEWIDESQTEEEQDRGWHALRKSLYRQGDKYLRTQKAKRLGYQPRDEVFYSEALLDELLPHIWDITEDVGLHYDEGPKPPSNPSEGGNRIVSLFDVQVALKQADDDMKKLLMLRYRDGIEPSDLAKLYEVSRTTIDRRLRRALKKLTDLLGGESPYGY